MTSRNSLAVTRYTAFDVHGRGGNPAGVVLDASGASEQEMQAVAAEVGYSETAFLVAGGDPADRRFTVRYFSPLAEVAFCGHATIAAAVAVADQAGTGRLVFDTPAGEVTVETRPADGRVLASLTSVPPKVTAVAGADLAEALVALRWRPEDLDPELPPRVANAGNDHLVLAAATRERLAVLDYDMDALGALMARCGWTTVHLVWRESGDVFHARDPFPPGGVYEDPATGAAAAAFGAYLRDLGLVAAPARVTIHQGADMGRPGRLLVDIPADTAAGITVSGTAAVI
ncbi:PhzF family phenazine biosynthesis isomerase [Nonomuraea sp. B12E4]|uniref:PhzF family phenazine biosynthesis protein n=1 Tax=Nonomuraea sp. B12E4 TaxID=3153564 RepID=UPI00325EB134